MKLARKRALITGASQGFGLAIARAFVEEGSEVMLCARSAEQLYCAQREVAELAKGRVRVLAMPADVSEPVDVQHLVKVTLTELGGIEILVCNAGIYGPKGPIEEVSWTEWSQAIAVNLMGTVLPCREVLPYFKKQGYGKILFLSGGGATKPLPYLSAYAASKAAVVRFGETLAEEVREFNIDVNAVAPGALNTRLLDEVLEAGPEKVGRAFYEQALNQKEQGGIPMERGASLCVFLASSASNGITGKLISAVWDPWENLLEQRDDLKNSDIYTLRRIVPKDRAKNWG
ncbi:MAG: SDR family oxidoreductase [Nitrososphaera sp.]|nr:SDR family oxidoreductase [Nitrososphaera sp.]